MYFIEVPAQDQRSSEHTKVLVLPVLSEVIFVALNGVCTGTFIFIYL